MPAPAPRPARRARTKQSPASQRQPGREHRSPTHIYSPTSASTLSELRPACSESPSPRSHVPPPSGFAAASPTPPDSEEERRSTPHPASSSSPASRPAHRCPAISPSPHPSHAPTQTLPFRSSSRRPPPTPKSLLRQSSARTLPG